MPHQPSEVPAPGTQVTLRVATAVGPISVVGEIVEADVERWWVRRRDGEIAEVSVASIEARREVAPGRAVTTSAAEIQQIAAFGWRAVETARLGEWLLRASAGFTQRANSALAIGDPGVPLDRALELVAEWYAGRGLPARLMQIDGVSPTGLTDGLLAGAWDLGVEVHLMTGEIAHALRAMPNLLTDLAAGELRLQLDDAPDDAWYACYLGDAAPISAAGRHVLEQHPSVVFGSLRDGDQAVAVARAAVDARWAGLFAVAVAPEHRRRRLGAGITLATLKEAARRGGRHVYLQVETSNAAALGLYERLNLRVHHDYRYWTPRSSSK